MPGKEGGRRNSEHEQEQGRTSEQLVLPAPSGFNEGTQANSMELDFPRVRGAHGARGGAGNSGAAKGRKRISAEFPESTSDGRGCFTGGLVNEMG